MHEASPSDDVLIRHGEFVRRLARRLLADEHEAEDVAQDAWVRYFEAAPRGLLDPRGWFTAVVANLARNRRRSRARRGERERRAARPEALDAADASLAEATALQALAQAVVELDEPYRGAIVARHFKGWEPARIARETGVPLATVKSRLQRAHALLRERLDRRHGGRATWTLAFAALLDPHAPREALAAATAAKVVVALSALAVLVWSTWRVSEPGLSARAPARAPALAVAAEAPSLERASEPATTREAAGATVPARLRVRGTVRDVASSSAGVAGGPASGVVVEIAASGSEAGGGARTVNARAESGVDGAFEVDLEPGTVAIRRVRASVAETDRFHGASVELSLEPGASTCAQFELARVAHGILEGVVVDVHGEPQPLARLELASSSADVPAVAVRAGPDGRLRTPLRGWLRGVKPLDAGVVLAGWTRPRYEPDGGQPGLRVVLARGASLRVRVVDARGAPISKLTVRAELDPSEKRAIGEAELRFTDTPAARTDDDGVATFDGLLAGHKLRLTIDGERTSAASGDELVFGDAADRGAPLVLAAGALRELRAVWRVHTRISGVARDETQRPIAGVDVELFELSPSDAGVAIERGSARTDEHGRYTLLVRRREIAGTARLVATGRRATIQRATRALDPSAFTAAATVVDFTLAPTLAIRGRVVDRDGTPLDGKAGALRLSIAPAGESAYVAARDASAPRVEWHGDGRFTVPGLAPGRYDLFVARVDFTFYSWAHGTQAFRGVEAGASDVELRYDPGAPVRIRVRITGEPSDGGVLLRAQLVPRDPTRAIEPAPRVQRVDDASSWPEGASLGFTGIGGAVDAEGAWTMGFDSIEPVDPRGAEREVELPPMAPGAYVIGLAPHADGERLAPIASALRAYASGEYTIELVVRGTTRLEGIVAGDVSSRRLALELLDAAGRAVPLETERGFGKPSRVLELDARGRFVVERAPVGEFTLRIGPLDELRAGRAAIERSVELARGVATRVALELP